MQPKLSPPKTSGSGVRCTSVTPDSALCINTGRELLRKPVDIRHAFSSLANQDDIKSLLLPHLLIEYESPGTAHPSALRQLKIAMVSALYQRHALRQPEHFVFGICQAGISTVHVVAAKWVPVAVEPLTGNQNLRDVGAMGNNAHASTSEVKLEESRQSHEDLEIEFYFLDQLDLALPIDLVRLYLLILATMSLAKVYRDQLVQNPSIRPAPGFCDWADDNSEDSKSQTDEADSLGSMRAPKRKYRDI
ncbi:hypothetical protein FRC10_001000 [Ceratobasidium sp. 414]|nr:hypothetical protein FRC10_001000 [Ceratobasidium sp. 414]